MVPLQSPRATNGRAGFRPGSACLGAWFSRLGFAASLGRAPAGHVIFRSILFALLRGAVAACTHFGGVSLWSSSAERPCGRTACSPFGFSASRCPGAEACACLGKTRQPTHLSVSTHPRIHCHSNLVLRQEIGDREGTKARTFPSRSWGWIICAHAGQVSQLGVASPGAPTPQGSGHIVGSSGNFCEVDGRMVEKFCWFLQILGC